MTYYMKFCQTKLNCLHFDPYIVTSCVQDSAGPLEKSDLRLPRLSTGVFGSNNVRWNWEVLDPNRPVPKVNEFTIYNRVRWDSWKKFRILPQLYLAVKFNFRNISQISFFIWGHFDRGKWTFRFGRKYKGFPKTHNGKTFLTCLSNFLFLNNFLARIGLTGVIAEVQTVI